jgi:tetratricopeptide (TPR) repeat protein
VKKFVPLVLIALLLCAAYAPTLRNGFVWDDTALILRDPLIRSWRLIPEGFQHFLFTDATASDFYRPIQRLTYTLEYVAVGFQPAVFHATSVACHVAAALAFFFFAGEFLRLFGAAEQTRRYVGLASALAWGLHPLHTSAVAYISGRADPLAAAFGFLGLYLALRSVRANGGGMWGFTIGALLAFVLSALSKEAGLIFVPLWMTICVSQRDWRSVARAAVVGLFVATIYFSLRMPAEHIPPPPKSNPPPLLVRPILFARAVAEYAGLIVLPINLHMERDVETRPSGVGNESLSHAAWRELQTLAGILCITAFVYALLRARRRHRALFVALVLTLLSYLPVSGIVSLNATVAEHWLYLPTTFLFLAVALRCARLFERASNPRTRPFPQATILTLAAVWVLFLGVRTLIRTFDWKDQRTFLERTIARGGDSPRMRINLGGLEMSEGRLEEAKKHLHYALQKEPEQSIAVINLAAVAVKENDYKTARELLDRAKAMPLVRAQAYELMTVLEHKETGQVNVTGLRLASDTGPADWRIERRYVQLLDEIGATDRAIAELQRILATRWYRAESWQMLAQLQQKAGRTAEAAQALEMARRFDVHLRQTPPVQ